MRRAVVALLAVAVAACGTLLGLEDRTLRDAGVEIDAGDAQTDAALCVDSGFCACTHHDFCEDFDEYKAPTELMNRWTNTIGYPSVVEIPPSVLTFDYVTVSPPSPPNALFVHTDVTFGKVGGAVLFTQLDPKANHVNPVIGLEIRLQMLVDSLVPDDAAVAIGDSGAVQIDDVLSVVNGVSSDGVGIALSNTGGFIGYALNVNTFGQTALGQGSQYTDQPVPPSPIYLPMHLVIAPRDALEVGMNTICKAGPVFAQPEAGVADAAVGPNPMVVVVFPPPGIGQITCEILGGTLLDPTWLQKTPLLVVGGVQSGLGKFQVVFDNITVDFLEQ